MEPDRCFHCALPVPEDCALTVDVDGCAEPVCCPGCKGKVAKAKGAAQAELVFANKNFDKHFVSAVKKKKDKE